MSQVFKLNQRGFTLIELLMVISILGALFSIAVPGYVKHRQRALATQCLAIREVIEKDEKAHIAEGHAPFLKSILDHKCPLGGTYVYRSTDQEDPAFGEVLCSLHSSGSTTPKGIAPAGENISENSGFDDLKNFPKNRKWTYMKNEDVPGWDSSDGFEVWKDGMLGVKSPDGDHFIELDTKRNQDSIFQTFETEKGRVYDITFKGRARRKGTSDVNISWGGKQLETVSPPTNEWNDYKIAVVGNGDPQKLTFSEVPGQNDSYGPLLDSIKVTPTNKFK